MICPSCGDEITGEVAEQLRELVRAELSAGFQLGQAVGLINLLTDQAVRSGRELTDVEQLVADRAILFVAEVNQGQEKRVKSCGKRET